MRNNYFYVKPHAATKAVYPYGYLRKRVSTKLCKANLRACLKCKTFQVGGVTLSQNHHFSHILFATWSRYPSKTMSISFTFEAMVCMVLCCELKSAA